MVSREITIIGAGPAGSACAILLARRGWAVTLIEQHRFPRDKVCGECLSATGLETLDQIGLLDKLRRLGPVVLANAEIHSTSGGSVRVRLPRPMWGISRRLFDQFLLDEARAAGAMVVQPARCEEIHPGPPLAVRIRNLESNQIDELHPRLVILADGKSALLGNPPAHTQEFGIKTHFEGVDGPRDAIELFGCRGLYGGLAAIESGRWNAAFSVPAHRLREHRGNVAGLFDQILTENVVLGRRLVSARRVSDWLASPLPRFAVRKHWHPGIIPVGNAAAALEPIGGEGMGLALRSALMAVDAIEGDLPNPGNVALRHQYRRLWSLRRMSCRAAAMIVSQPRLAEALSPWAARFPGPLNSVLRLMGK